MNKLNFPCLLLALIVLIFGLTGCIVPRSEGAAGDIQSFVPSVEVVAPVEAAAQDDTGAIIRV